MYHHWKLHFIFKKKQLLKLTLVLIFDLDCWAPGKKILVFFENWLLVKLPLGVAIVLLSPKTIV